MSGLDKKLLALRPQLAAAAQEIYAAWDPDETGEDVEYGSGGPCDDIAEALAEVVVKELEEVEILDGGQEGDDHAFIYVRDSEEAFGVDIPPNVYEKGGGYMWTKKKGVTISPDDVAIWAVELEDE